MEDFRRPMLNSLRICQTNTDSRKRVRLNAVGSQRRHALGVKRPGKATVTVLDKAVDLLFQMYVLRGECGRATRALLSKPRVDRADEAAVEEYARLDDTLAGNYRVLQKTLRGIQR